MYRPRLERENDGDSRSETCRIPRRPDLKTRKNITRSSQAATGFRGGQSNQTCYGSHDELRYRRTAPPSRGAGEARARGFDAPTPDPRPPRLVPERDADRARERGLDRAEGVAPGDRRAEGAARAAALARSPAGADLTDLRVPFWHGESAGGRGRRRPPRRPASRPPRGGLRGDGRRNRRRAPRPVRPRAPEPARRRHRAARRGRTRHLSGAPRP